MKPYISAILALLMILSGTPVYAAANLLPNPNPQFFNNSGAPCSGCKLYFYESGTSTAKDTYISSAMTTTNANPVVLNSRGEAATGIWLDGEYSVTLKTSAGSTIWGPKANIRGVGDLAALDVTGIRWINSVLTPAYVGTTQFSFSGDQTAIFHVGRRVKVTETAGTVYGRVTASSYAATVTTVTVALDSGTIDSGISVVAYSLESATNSSLSFDMVTSGTMSTSGSTYIGGATTITGNVSSSGTNTITGQTVINNAGSWISAADSLLFTSETYTRNITMTEGAKDLSLGNVVSGDRALFMMDCVLSGGTGTIDLAVSQVGSASATLFNSSSRSNSSNASIIPKDTLTGMALFTSSGTATLRGQCITSGPVGTWNFYAVPLKTQ